MSICSACRNEVSVSLAPLRHARDLFGALCIIQKPDGGFGAALLFLLLDKEMLIRESGDLREVGDAEDLLGAGERLQLLADSLGGTASDADVDFVEDERARDLSLLLGRGIGAFFDADFQARA